jgi:uncharacterized protein YaiE (UPF0345 family)
VNGSGVGFASVFAGPFGRDTPYSLPGKVAQAEVSTDEGKRTTVFVTRSRIMKHSVYFDGKVQSLGVNTANGFATVGVIEPGTYTFSTSSKEHIVLIEGTLRVRLPDEDWKVFSKGEEIVVQPKVSFDIQAQVDVAYVCYYR